jgi:hypothetical protein
MFYSGESNVPGAPGNLFAGGNFMGGAGSAINPEALKRDARQQKIYNKGVRTDNPSEKEIFLQRTGPQLPFAGIGNVGGMLAQSYPMYGDTINMGPADTDYSNMPVIPNPVQEQMEREALLEEYRNRVFPQQTLPFGFEGKYLS